VKTQKFLVPVLYALTLIQAAGDSVTLWNFNSPTPDSNTSTGVSTPSLGLGTASLVGGTSATWSVGSTNDPAPSSDNSGWNTTSYPAQATGNKSAGVQFIVSTLGYSNIVVRWDLKVSGSGSKYYRLQYASDGYTFFDFPSAVTNQNVSSTASYYEAHTNSLADVADVNDNANFVFRIVSEFENSATGAGSNGYVTTFGTNSYSTVGTVRYDMVTVSGTPIPGANTPPSISSVSNQTLRVNHSSAALPITIGDAQDPAASLTLDKSSSDPSVIPLSGIAFGGSDSNRTVTVTAGAQTGTSQITVYAIDTGGRSNQTTFSVTVLPENTTPTISAIAATNTLVSVSIPSISFTVGDLETPASNLLVTALSGNTTLLPPGGIFLGGSGANRTVTLTPAPGETGAVPVSLTVSDGTNTATTVFSLMVTPSTNVVLIEPFTYADGSLLTNSGFLWSTRSGVAGQAQVLGGQFLLSATQTEDVVGSLIGGPFARSNSIVLYAGFKVKFVSLPKIIPGQFAEFADSSVLRGRIYAGTSNAAPGSFRLQVANGSDTTTELPTDLNTNVSYTVVLRYALDTATTRLWLNPAAESDPGVDATDAQSAASISEFGFRQDTDIGATLLVDDLKVGLTFASVLPGETVNPIPLNFQRLVGKLVLSWTNPAFALQSAPAAPGTYTNVPNASSPFTNSTVGPPKFFRLKVN
jgi:hypothetical protein